MLFFIKTHPTQNEFFQLNKLYLQGTSNKITFNNETDSSEIITSIVLAISDKNTINNRNRNIRNQKK